MNDFTANLAWKKPATQSGTWHEFAASRAVDDRKDTASCTAVRVHPWWSVDLRTMNYVGSVTVTNSRGSKFGNYHMVIENLMPISLREVCPRIHVGLTNTVYDAGDTFETNV